MVRFQSKLLPLLVLLLLNVVKTKEFPFPKILWVYWDSGQANLQLFTKLCANNMRHYAKISNWQFRFLSDQTVYDYISVEGQERIERMLKPKSIYLARQTRADILRLHLIYENGGMWLDLNSVFLNDFSWIENIDIQINITNKIGTYPDYLAFSNNDFNKKVVKYFDKKIGIQVELFPPVQIWFILAKKGALFLKDILQNIEYTLGQDIQEIYAENDRMGIQYGAIDTYFIASNYQFQKVLQKKQRQIDANPQQFKTKYAVEYYKLWTLQAQRSALALLYQTEDLSGINSVQIYNLMHKSLQYLKQNHNITPYFFKFTNAQYHKISRNIQKITQSLCGTNQRLFEEDSVLNQYFFRPSMHLEEVKLMSTLNFEGRVQVNAQLCTEAQSIRSLVSSLYQQLFFILFGALFLCLFVYHANFMPEQREEEYGKLKSLSQSDDSQ